MRSKIKFLILLLLSFGITGCSSHSARGTVEMQINSQEAHVRFDEHELKVGDRVAAFRNDCQDGLAPAMNSYGVRCYEKQISAGTVTRLLNGHYSVVKFDERIKAAEGILLKKI